MITWPNLSKITKAGFLRHPEVMKPLPGHSKGQQCLETVVRSDCRPKMKLLDILKLNFDATQKRLLW